MERIKRGRGELDERVNMNGKREGCIVACRVAKRHGFLHETH